jgi:D-aminopeptidase
MGANTRHPDPESSLIRSEQMNSLTPTSASVAQKLDELFEPWNRSDAPGVIAGIAHEGEVIYRRAFGLASIEHATALTPATRMRIGSTTKQFCALAIMLLAEEGILDIHQPVRTYLPELTGISGEPTLLQLMHHTGGLHDPMMACLFVNGGSFGQLPAGGTLQLLPRMQERNFVPGTRLAYSNCGYTLLTLVTERVSGQSWEVFMAERVFGPMSMNDTMLLRSDLDIQPGVATPHCQQNDGSWRRGIYPSDELLGAGGIISTVDDMLIWAAHLRSAKKTIGTAATWEQMVERQRFANGCSTNYGLGLMVSHHRGVEYVHHAGATFGAQCQMLTAPAHELDIVILTNRADASAQAIALRALEAILEERGLGPEEPQLNAADYAAVQGRWYSLQSHTLLEITSRKLKPEMPEVMLASVHNSPVGAWKRGGSGGLDTSEGPFSKLEIRKLPEGATPPDSIDVHVCGDLERFDRLPAAPTAQDLASELCGRYRYVAFGKEVELRFRDDKLWLDLLPLCGRAEWEIEVCSDAVLACGVLHTIPPATLPMPATLSFERKGGKVTGFWFDTDRWRNVRFDRCLSLPNTENRE